jgi:hypothetical protein
MVSVINYSLKFWKGMCFDKIATNDRELTQSGVFLRSSQTNLFGLDAGASTRLKIKGSLGYFTALKAQIKLRRNTPLLVLRQAGSIASPTTG